MPKFNKYIVLLLTTLLVACGSAPKPELTADSQSQPVVEATANDTATVTDENVEAADQAAQAEPVDPEQLAYEAAVAELKDGETESALDELKRLSGIAPDKPRMFTNLGLAHFRLQQYEAAEQAFREAILRNQDDAVAHNHLGILERRKGQFGEALKAYQRAIEIDVKYARAHLNLGILFDLYLQDLEKALQQYRIYQDLTNNDNEQVAGWIVDIERRLKSNKT